MEFASGKGRNPNRRLTSVEPETYYRRKLNPKRSQSLNETDKIPSLRGSVLIPDNAANDAAWFAKRGLMSRKSFKLYKKEAKKEKKKFKKKKKSKRDTIEEVKTAEEDFSKSLNDMGDSKSTLGVRSSMDSEASDFDKHYCAFRSSLDNSELAPQMRPLDSMGTSDDTDMSNKEPNDTNKNAQVRENAISRLAEYRIEDIDNKEEEEDDESITLEIPEKTIEVGEFQDNMISSLNMDFHASKTLQFHWENDGGGGKNTRTDERRGSDSSSTSEGSSSPSQPPVINIQQVQNNWDKSYNVSAQERKDITTMGKQISFKADSRVTSSTSDTTMEDERGMMSPNNIDEYMKLRGSDITQQAGNLRVQQQSQEEDDDVSITLDDVKGESNKPPIPPPGTVIHVSRDNLLNQISALDMGFSSRTLQETWVNSDSLIDTTERSSGPSSPVKKVRVSDLSMGFSSKTLEAKWKNSDSLIDTSDRSSSSSERGGGRLDDSMVGNDCVETKFQRNESSDSGNSMKPILRVSREHSPEKKEPRGVSFLKNNTIAVSTNKRMSDVSALTVSTRNTTGSSFATPDTSNDVQAELLVDNEEDSPKSCPSLQNKDRNETRKPFSSLVARTSSIDVSWFAQNGCMSRESYKKYKKETKKNLLRQLPRDAKRRSDLLAHSNSLPPCGDIDQQTWASSYATAHEDGKESGFTRSVSLGEGMDLLLGSFVDSLTQCDDARKSLAFATLLDSLLVQKRAILQPDEVTTLKTIVRRLSSVDDETSDDDDSFFRSKPCMDATRDIASPQDVTLADVLHEVEEEDEDDTLIVCKDITIPPQSKRDSTVSAITAESTAIQSREKRLHNVEAVVETTTQVAPSTYNQSCTLDTSHADSKGPDDIEDLNEVLVDERSKATSLKNDKDRRDSTMTCGAVIWGQEEATTKPTAEYDTDEAIDPLDNSEHATCKSVYEVPRSVSIPDAEHKISELEQLESRGMADHHKYQHRDDVLTEGMDYLSLVMLVKLYGKLRELSVLGFTSSKLIDIDVNSHQSLARQKEMKRLGLRNDESKPYIDNTRTARFVVQHILDEYDMFATSNELCGQTYRANIHIDYEASLLQDFKTWVDESKVEGNTRFSKGSLLMSLVNSGPEVVWFSDRHPDDLIYCICIDRESTTVTVIFRDEESTLKRLRDASMMEHPNPLVDDYYEGNTDFIGIRAAVSEELLRPRRDTGKTTIDEISEKVHKIGKELGSGGRYNLSVTGHSKAGGLATVCGFYLAANPSLELASAVRIFAFASSRVGDGSFHQSFQHLEETGRILHARFTNSNELDSLPLLAKGGDRYEHVGINIRLHADYTRQLDIRYVEEGGLASKISHTIKNCMSGKDRCLSQYQHRMHSSREYWKVQSTNQRSKRKKCLPSLDELYSLNDKINMSEKGKEKIASSSIHIYILVSFFVSLEIALLLRMAEKIL